MSVNTYINTIQIKEILSSFYAIENIEKIELLKGGSENINYAIYTSNNDFVLTICQQKSQEETIQLASLLSYLNEQGFSTSQIIPTKSGISVADFNTKPVVLKTFIKGEITKDLSDYHLENLGKQLAQLHQIEAPEYLPKEISFGVQAFNKVAKYDKGSDFDVWLTQLAEEIKTSFSNELPKSLIHSDIFYSNVIVDSVKNTTTIMDFEEACYYYRVFDIGMLIVGTCIHQHQISLEKAALVIKGYQQGINLSALEKDTLQLAIVYAAAATAYWRHQNFNFVVPNAEKKDTYLEMKTIADFVRDISKDKFREIYKY